MTAGEIPQFPYSRLGPYFGGRSIPESPQEDFLCRILGFVHPSEQPPGKSQNPPLVPDHELLECRRLARDGSGDQGRFRGRFFGRPVVGPNLGHPTSFGAER